MMNLQLDSRQPEVAAGSTSWASSSASGSGGYNARFPAAVAAAPSLLVLAERIGSSAFSSIPRRSRCSGRVLRQHRDHGQLARLRVGGPQGRGLPRFPSVLLHHPERHRHRDRPGLRAHPLMDWRSVRSARSAGLRQWLAFAPTLEEEGLVGAAPIAITAAMAGIVARVHRHTGGYWLDQGSGAPGRPGRPRWKAWTCSSLRR